MFSRFAAEFAGGSSGDFLALRLLLCSRLRALAYQRAPRAGIEETAEVLFLHHKP